VYLSNLYFKLLNFFSLVWNIDNLSQQTVQIKYLLITILPTSKISTTNTMSCQVITGISIAVTLTWSTAWESPVTVLTTITYSLTHITDTVTLTSSCITKPILCSIFMTITGWRTKTYEHLIIAFQFLFLNDLHVAPLEYIILIPSLPVFALTS